jgi:hypothetical protein
MYSPEIVTNLMRDDLPLGLRDSRDTRPTGRARASTRASRDFTQLTQPSNSHLASR